MKTETLSIKVSKDQKNHLQDIAAARNTRPSALLRAALWKVLEGEGTGKAVRMSLFQRQRHFFKGLDKDNGPEDLSTNPAHFRNFGK